MTEKNRTYRHELFRMLLAGTVGICLLTVALFLGFFLSYTNGSSKWFLERDTAEYVRYAASSFHELLEEYEQVAEELSESEALLTELRDNGMVETSRIYQRLYHVLDGRSISPVIHLVNVGQEQIISTGSKNETFSPENYASIPMILEVNRGTQTHAGRFTNTSGQTVVLVFARELLLDGELLGYLYLDLSEEEIQNMFASDPEMQINGQESYANYIIYNWYDYVVYNKSNLSGLRLGTNYINRSFAETFRMEQPKAITYQSGEAEYLLSGMQDVTGEFVVLCAVPMGLLQKNNQQIVFVTLGISVLMLIICFGFTLKINRSILDPIRNILDTMERVGQGDLTVRSQFRSNNELSMIRDQLNQMIVDIDRAFRENEEKQQQLLLAEDNVLKAQIKPHFLNNVLETIHWMVKMGEGDAACEALRNLGKMMTERMSYNSAPYETLNQSLEFTKHYLGIQKLCYPGKFIVQMEVCEQALVCRVPTFLLQPLVENAIIHGLQPKLGNGTLHIRAVIEEDELRIFVRDDGIGMSERTKENLLQPGGYGHGIGLYNVHRRLQLYYGEDYGLCIRSRGGEGTEISMRIPMEKTHCHEKEEA